MALGGWHVWLSKPFAELVLPLCRPEDEPLYHSSYGLRMLSSGARGVKRSENGACLARAANQIMSLSRATSLGATHEPLRPVTYGEHPGWTSAPAGGRDLRTQWGDCAFERQYMD